MRWKSTVLLLALIALVVMGCSATKPIRTKPAKPAPVVSEEASSAAMEYVLRGATAEASGDFWQAISLYRLAIDRDPHSVSMYHALTELYLKVNEGPAARTTIDRALALEPNNEKTIELMSSVAFNLRDPRMMGWTLQRWRELSKDNPDAVGKIAAMYFLSGNRDGAKQMYLDGIAKYGMRATWGDKLAGIYLMSRDWKNASEVLTKLAELEPDLADRWIDAGEAALGNRDTTAARTFFQKAIETDPRQSQAWRSALLLAFVTHDTVKSDSLLAAGLKVLPDDVDLLGFKARILQQQRRYPEAMEIVKRAIANDSTRLNLYLDLGFLAHELKEFALAETSYQKALELDSAAALVLNNYAYLLATQTRDLDKALAMANRAVEAEPDNASYYDTRGWIYCGQKKYSEAKPIWKKRVNSIPIMPKFMSI